MSKYTAIFFAISLPCLFTMSVSADDYDNGLYHYTQRQYDEAFQAFHQAAESADAGAAYELSKMYKLGFGTQANEDSALQWLMVSAYYGLAQAQFELANFYYGRQDIAHHQENGFHWAARAAEQGHAEAHFLLAQAYEKGWGTSVDYRRAMKLYRFSVGHFTVHAQKGNPDAQFQLARLYEKGNGVKQNWTEALRLYKQAGLNGSASALFHAGRLLMVQARNQREQRAAAYWLKLAATHGEQSASSLLEKLEREMAKQTVAGR